MVECMTRVRQDSYRTRAADLPAGGGASPQNIIILQLAHHLAQAKFWPKTSNFHTPNTPQALGVNFFNIARPENVRKDLAHPAGPS